MAKTLKITAKMLEDKKACRGQVEKFRAVFGESVEFKTMKAAVAAAIANSDFEWDWAARNLFGEDGYAAYRKAEASAGEAYEKAKAPAWEAYEKARASAWEAYRKAEASAGEAYEKARASAGEAYEKARASAFAKIAWKELAA